MYRTIKITVCISCTIIILIMSSYAILIREFPIMTGFSISNEEVMKIASQLNKELDNVKSNRTKEDYRKIIENDFNCHFYIYKEKDLPEGVDGQCIPIFRTIIIDSELDSFYYCSSFAHEMIHLTNYIEQENYVTYQTFKYLYEHSDPEFHNFGIRVALHSLYNAYPQAYDCKGEIIGYINNNNTSINKI